MASLWDTQKSECLYDAMIYDKVNSEENTKLLLLGLSEARVRASGGRGES